MGTSVPFMFIGSCVLASFEKVLNNVAEDFDGDIWRFLRVNHSDPDIVVRRCCHLGNLLKIEEIILHLVVLLVSSFWVWILLP